jgi:hypothetical protein
MANSLLRHGVTDFQDFGPVPHEQAGLRLLADGFARFGAFVPSIWKEEA